VNFCHIEIVLSQPNPLFFHAQQVRPPRCPHCKHEVLDWHFMIQQWQQDKSQFSYICPECHLAIDVTQLDWRSKAGFAREMINIWGIFEGEAIPNFAFLAQLKQWSGGINWQYCHATGDIY